jgi:chromosome segregation ATPase
MLKEVTGTASFDKRVEKMNEVLEESKTKKVVLEETLNNISTRLDTLSQETEEVKQMKSLEGDKRALELAIFTQKTQSVENQISEIRNIKNELIDSRNQIVGKLN